MTPCGCFKGLTQDGQGCLLPKGHDGDCRPYHEPEPALQVAPNIITRALRRLAMGCWVRHDHACWEHYELVAGRQVKLAAPRLRCPRCGLVVWCASAVRARLS